MRGAGHQLAIGAMANLTYLDLGANQIGDVGMTALSSALVSGALPALAVLNLAANQIGDPGMMAFATSLGKQLKPS